MTESISGKGPRPPLAVWASIAASLGTVVWIAGLTPDRNPSLTIEWGETGLVGLVFAVVVVAGTILGVRFLWGVFCFQAAAVFGLIFGSMLSDADPQSVGAAVLSLASLALIVLPSVVRYETKRLRLVTEEREDLRGRNGMIPVLLLIAMLAVFAFLLLGAAVQFS